MTMLDTQTLPEPEQMALLAGTIRAAVVERSRQHKSTDPTPADIKRMVELTKLAVARGADPAAYLEGLVKVILAAAEIVLTDKQMNCLHTNVLCLDAFIS